MTALPGSHPSRRPLRGLLRMTFFLNAILGFVILRSARRARLEGRAVRRLVALLLITLALAGCGKKGAPQPPADEPNTYPRTYPSG